MGEQRTVKESDDLCEWDPRRNAPAQGIPVPGGYEGYTGCKARATMFVGANGAWRLCDGCAALPRFKRYRKRLRLSEVRR